ncbi:MAG TPA: phosphoadenylyl-sulfate reductase [Balneolales bacterium]|nr:phosphoadenylyl-sulfate reductase [Balneolales bacterium]
MEKLNLNDIKSLNRHFADSVPSDILKWLWSEKGERAVLGTGFGPSGIVLIDLLHKAHLGIPVFYLDTHLFFPETYELRDQLQDRFNCGFIKVSTSLSLDEQEKEYGSKLWETNPNKCCYLRKVLPLKWYLRDKDVWITGVRRSQSESRKNTQLFEWDPQNEVVKVNPLATWTSEEVWAYVTIHELPYNPLHDDGYPSIGCVPCTHPVFSDDERAGRWPGMAKMECGIHLPTQDNDK